MTSMKLRRVKVLAAAVGSGAAIALAVIGVTESSHGAGPAVNLARGDSETSTQYLPPTVPAMTANSATAMSTGATVVATTPSTVVAEVATPSVTPSAVEPCSSNGVVMPGGCH